MPYSQVTLSQLVTQVSSLLDDETAVYWTAPEITYAIWEALRVFGAVTNYWRKRGTFDIQPSDTSPFYDLNVEIPALRSRDTTLDQIVKEIQYHLLEFPSGISGAGGSGQVTVDSILQAIQRARNRFVLDVHFPNYVHPEFAPVSPPVGIVEFPQESVFVHRVSWQDAGGAWANLWRQDDWAFDHANNQWPSEPGWPTSYSEASLAPLVLQMYPAPVDAGTMEAVTVDSMLVDISDPAATFDIPDEWIHAVKYAALEDILTGGGQITDDLRGQYASQRYDQAVAFARDARTVIRLTCNGLPLPIDSLAAIDAGFPYWRNQVGSPQMAGILYDVVAINPGAADQTYGIGVDVVTPAPLPTGGQFVQIGQEDLENILDYASHYLTFKCGGQEFKSTMNLYDNFMKAVSMRKGVNAAKISYFETLFGKWQTEQVTRPDAMGVKA